MFRKLPFCRRGWINAGFDRNLTSYLGPSVSTRFWGNDDKRVCRGFSSKPRLKPKDRFSYPEGVLPYEEDYTEFPEYPEIDPETHQLTEVQRNKRQAILDWHQKIRDEPNPEGKTFELNMPRGFGYKCIMLTENRFEYDSESVYKFITRSRLVENDLPEIYSSPELTKEAKYYAEKLRGPILEALSFELNEQSRNYEDDLGESAKSVDFKRSQSIVTQINRIILSLLGSEVEHLSNCQVDLTPKIEAFWLMGGQQPSKLQRTSRLSFMKRTNFKKCKKKEDDPVERAFQYKGSPLLQLRCENPINNFVDMNSPLGSLPPDAPLIFPYRLDSFGVGEQKYNYASLIPGTWATDKSRSSHIAFHPRHHLVDDAVQSSEYWIGDSENALASQAMMASFGRLLAQALYFGYDQFTELHYPFSSQTIITDGLKWSFSAYQLNTIQLAEFHLYKNSRQNICWKTNTMNILDEAGDEKNLNMTTLETILKFYLNKPNAVPLVKNPTPYLKSPLPKMEDEIRREIVYHNYRDMVSQRWSVMENVLTRQMPEIYEWERIYKIRHFQRYFEPRRRFFEFPNDFPGSKPYETPYQLLNPRHVGKRMRFLMEEVAARKEQERIDEAKRAESAKYGIFEEPKAKPLGKRKK